MDLWTLHISILDKPFQSYTNPCIDDIEQEFHSLRNEISSIKTTLK